MLQDVQLTNRQCLARRVSSTPYHRDHLNGRAPANEPGTYTTHQSHFLYEEMILCCSAMQIISRFIRHKSPVFYYEMIADVFSGMKMWPILQQLNSPDGSTLQWGANAKVCCACAWHCTACH